MTKVKDVRISHPDKELFPGAGIGKEELARYYGKVARPLLGQVRDRPISIRVYPGGINADGFFRKQVPDYFPDYIQRIRVPTESGSIRMTGLKNPRDLVYLAGQNAIEFHMCLSRKSSLNKPDQLVFDFDPSDENAEQAREAALAFKEMLEGINLPGFVKATGSRGVHVHIPLRPELEFEDIKPLARKLAKGLNVRTPGLTTTEQRKSARGSRVFIDYLRNDYAQTACVPYSVRARSGAPVSIPLSWKEFREGEFNPEKWDLRGALRRLARVERDPWEHFHQKGVSCHRLESAIGKLA